jgi:formylglycine-generating enzyme required for sulfatase activity
MAAKFFGNHHGYLCFCNLKKVTKTQAEGLCNHKGTLCLKGLTSVSKETELVLRKIEKAEFVGKVANKITADFKTVAAKLKQEKEAKAKQMELVKLSIEKEMVLIPAGTFMMGSPVTEKGRQPSETHHEVTLTKQFYMGKYEVTQEQWESVMGNIPSTLSRWAKYPVTDVSWEDCQAFIKKLNASTKGGYRLPYEAEWEYACRAGTTTAYSYGDNLTKSDANIDGDSIKAVGSYRPNAFGVYDMHGNVWEWCEDWYGSLQDGEVTDPKGSATGESRVLRGGAFACDESAARSSSRGTRAPSVRYNGYGFRLARTP